MKYLKGIDAKKLRLESIIRLHAYGKTLKEIGDFHGITKERVRQILAKYRDNLNGKPDLSTRVKLNP